MTRRGGKGKRKSWEVTQAKGLGLRLTEDPVQNKASTVATGEEGRWAWQLPLKVEVTAGRLASKSLLQVLPEARGRCWDPSLTDTAECQLPAGALLWFPPAHLAFPVSVGWAAHQVANTIDAGELGVAEVPRPRWWTHLL